MMIRIYFVNFCNALISSYDDVNVCLISLTVNTCIFTFAIYKKKKKSLVI